MNIIKTHVFVGISASVLTYSYMWIKTKIQNANHVSEMLELCDNYQNRIIALERKLDGAKIIDYEPFCVQQLDRKYLHISKTEDGAIE